MTSYNTVLHPTRGDSNINVTNVNGDHLTFHYARDIIILHYHALGPSSFPDRDRASECVVLCLRANVTLCSIFIA